MAYSPMKPINFKYASGYVKKRLTYYEKVNIGILILKKPDRFICPHLFCGHKFEHMVLKIVFFLRAPVAQLDRATDF
jgi:hypothetical protein